MKSSPPLYQLWAKHSAQRPRTKNQPKDVVLEHLDEAIAAASGDGEYRFN